MQPKIHHINWKTENGIVPVVQREDILSVVSSDKWGEIYTLSNGQVINLFTDELGEQLQEVFDKGSEHIRSVSYFIDGELIHQDFFTNCLTLYPNRLCSPQDCITLFLNGDVND